MPASSPDHEFITYKISYNTTLQDKKYGITGSVRNLLEELFFDCGKGKKSTIKRLRRAIKKYPKVPQFKNYLSKEYVAAGNERKADEVTDWILESHPDYLFGKVNKAHSLMQKGKTESVPELLGEFMELQALYPEREEFHIDEVLSFYLTTVFYFLDIEDREEAGKRLELLEELDAHSNQVQLARERVMLFDMESNLEKNLQTGEHDRRIERTVTSRSYRKSTQTDTKPRFHHSKTDLLYTTGLEITDEQIGQILSLPQKTLVEDLEAVLEDTINRFEVFKEKMMEEGWVENEYDFSIHAVAFLAELKSEQSLPSVLELFRQGDEFLDFWYGDRLEGFFEAPVAALAQNQLHVLRDFLKEPNNPYFARNIAVTAVEQIASAHPAKRESVIELLEEWIHFMLDHEQDDTIFDTNLLGFIVWSCTNLKTKKLLGLIKTLYEKDFIPLMMVGSYEDVEFDILRDEPLPVKNPFDICSYYQKIESNPLFKSDEPERPPEPPLPASSTNPLISGGGNHSEPAINTWKDVGRNDPCPCGSGRKYKKCCLR